MLPERAKPIAVPTRGAVQGVAKKVKNIPVKKSPKKTVKLIKNKDNFLFVPNNKIEFTKITAQIVSGRRYRTLYHHDVFVKLNKIKAVNTKRFNFTSSFKVLKTKIDKPSDRNIR